MALNGAKLSDTPNYYSFRLLRFQQKYKSVETYMSLVIMVLL